VCFLLWVLCFVRHRSLRRANHSSRGVLPTLVRRYVWSRNLVNEEPLAHWGLFVQKNKGLIDLKILYLLTFGLWSCGICHRGFWQVFTRVSDKHSTLIFRVEV